MTLWKKCCITQNDQANKGDITLRFTPLKQFEGVSNSFVFTEAKSSFIYYSRLHLPASHPSLPSVSARMQHFFSCRTETNRGMKCVTTRVYSTYSHCMKETEGKVGRGEVRRHWIVTRKTDRGEEMDRRKRKVLVMSLLGTTRRWLGGYLRRTWCGCKERESRLSSREMQREGGRAGKRDW